MYRNLRDNRYDIDVQRFQNAIQLLSFKRDDNFPVGLLMKSLLTRQSINYDEKRGSLAQEFGLNAQ